MTEHSVLHNIDERGVVTITLNRPDKRNAFDDRVIAALAQQFEVIGNQAEARVMVLQGSGKHFSAGGDVAWMQRMSSYSDAENKRDAMALATMLRSLAQLPVPTIARVQGAVMGGAVGLVSCCDMVVAASDARFCLSEVKIGLIPATISPYVIAAIGERAARRYFTTAETFTAQRAAQLGLVSEVVAQAQLDQQTEQLIDAILGNGPEAVRAAKQLVQDVSGKKIDQALLTDTSERIAAIRVSAEGQAGLQAFLNKQPPPWLTKG